MIKNRLWFCRGRFENSEHDDTDFLISRLILFILQSLNRVQKTGNKKPPLVLLKCSFYELS
jgi:hypothetical protein